MSIEVEAQITGNVWKIEKAVGDSVEEEDVLLIVESMKMEIPVAAPAAGKVTHMFGLLDERPAPSGAGLYVDGLIVELKT